MSKSLIASGVSSEPIDTPTEASVLSEATARPWRVVETSPPELFVVGDNDQQEVCKASAMDRITDQDRADAALIVRAVNNHDALVKALEEIYRHMSDPNIGTRETYPVFGLNFPSLMLKASAALNSVRESSTG